MFWTRYKYFKYFIMPFGLANAFAIFQIYINYALTNLINMFCIIYFNNIFIYFNLKEKH